MGAIAVFLGVFVQFAGENQSIGFFGDWSMRADEVSDAWKLGLLAGGCLLLGVSFASVALRRSRGAGGTTLASRVYTGLAVLGLAGALAFGVIWLLALAT